MRVGTVAFCTHQGISHLARDFFRAGVISRVMPVRHRAYGNHLEEFYPDPMTRYGMDQVDAFLTGLDALLLFETDLSKDWMVSRLAKQRGIKVCLVVMYEYSQFPPPVKPDLVICPSALDLDYWGDHYDCVQLTVPVNQLWQLRERALTFVHNAGHGQHEYAKGTLEVIAAMDLVRSPVVLKIRAQLDDRKMSDLYAKHRNHPRLDWEVGDLPAHQLYAYGDVFVNAEQFNGLSLPLQEAWASGMVVMTSDRYPASTWLPPEPLIPVKEYVKYRIPGGSGITFDRAVIEPKDIALAIDGIYGSDISRLSLEGKAWAEANSWEQLKPRWVSALEDLL